jgi:hypothetical protein
LRRISLAMFGGTVAIVLFLPTSGAAAARCPVPSVSSPAAVASSQAPAVKTIPRVLPCLGLPQVRPANYLMSCADANASWKKVKWASWGAKTALGTGDLYQNDCQPNCVSGQFHTYLAKLVLSDVKQTKKYGPLYSQATFSYSVKGKHMSETFGLAT